MKRHRSQPYNPNIANGFFRAGYVETWGRGIEKICEACRAHGVPEYTLHLEDIMVKFTALQVSKNENPKVPKYQNDTLDDTLEKKIIFVIKENIYIKQIELAKMINVSIPTVKRVIKQLTDKGILERKGGKRYGYWEINENINVDKGNLKS